MPKPGHTGFKRLIFATGYSFKGFKAAWVNEAAFRQELTLTLVMLPLAFWLGESALAKVLLIATLLLVLIVELLNSAVEALVDLVTDEYEKLAGRAKDMGSAAVFVSLVLVLVVWVGVTLERFVLS